MVITLSFNLSKEGVSEVHFVTGEHNDLFITLCFNKVEQDGAVNDLKLKAHGQI